MRRDGQFVQLTELLYRTMEQIDGTKDVEAIAGEVSKRSGKQVSADDVRRLLAKVIPLGLVVKADGSVEQTAEAGSAERSPLAVNMRMAVIPEGAANAVGSIFSAFFLPPVVVSVLALGVVAHLWLYFGHGVGQSFRQVLYAPGLLLIVIGAYALSAAFHEIGHAAALRYGGGRVRKMGVGLYLVYPVFYTDVTENYRLPKGSRLRTDLGGFYFNLLFFLGAIGLYFLTGQEYLLLIAALADLEVLYQLLPFGRLDGYWILSDLTGIPDLFTHMVSFFRGLMPGQKGQAPAKLKPWAKAVFLGYTLIVVPLFALLIFLLVKGFPRIAVTALDSAAQRVAAAGSALSASDPLGVAANVLQVLILALQVVGLGWILIKLARGWARGLGALAGRSPVRRGGAMATNAVALVLIVVLWLPQIPVIGVPGPLYAQARFEPITTGTRWVVPHAVPALAPLAAPFGGAEDPTPAPSPYASPSRSDSPASSPSPTATAAPTAAPTLRPTAAPTVVRTPSPAPTTPAPATPAPTPTP